MSGRHFCLRPKSNIGPVGIDISLQDVQKPKPGIVPGLAVFGPRITEAYNQE